MKHEAQQRVIEATRGMSEEERGAYVNKRAEEMAKSMYWRLESAVSPQGSVEVREVTEGRRAG